MYRGYVDKTFYKWLEVQRRGYPTKFSGKKANLNAALFINLNVLILAKKSKLFFAAR